MVDPHFGVIDDAGHHPVFAGFSNSVTDAETGARNKGPTFAIESG